MDRATLGPPADLVALTEPCVRCGGDGFVDAQSGYETSGDCSDCIDGHPAITVYGETDRSICAPLGRGTIQPEHILPVMADYPPDDNPAIYRHDTSPISRWWFVKASPDGWHVPLDIDVSPGQYVAIVTPEAT
jgi:hypothetical protein